MILISYLEESLVIYRPKYIRKAQDNIINKYRSFTSRINKLSIRKIRYQNISFISKKGKDKVGILMQSLFETGKKH